MGDAIEIMELREAGEDGGDLMGYYCKGHLPRHEFAKAANVYSGALDEYDIRYVRADRSHHVWWRVVPMAGQPGQSMFQGAEPNSRGAFPATVCESLSEYESKRFRYAQRRYDEGYRRGIQDGVNWALTWLDRADPEMGKRMLATFQAKRDEIEMVKP